MVSLFSLVYLSSPQKLPTPFLHLSSPSYSLPLVGLPSWGVVFPKQVGPFFPYTTGQTGLTTHSWNDSIRTCTSLQICVRQANFPKALYHALGDISWWSVRTIPCLGLSSLFGTTQVGLTYMGLNLRMGFDSRTIQFIII